MAHLDASSAECLVYTYKEGLLSAVAHDLAIRVERFEIDVDEGTLALRARFEAASLRVVGPVRGGVTQADGLGTSDRSKIEQSIVEDVLHVGEHASIAFVSSSVATNGASYAIEGDLTLHGRTRRVAFVARPEGDRMVAEIRLHQPDFGIKPFSAMLGALKIKPDVTVRCTVPRASLPSGG